MGTQYAVIHIEKTNSNVSALGKHNDRTSQPKNANKELSLLNKEIVSHNGDLNKSIAERIEKGYKGKISIRKDAVKSMSIVLTGTHEAMKDLEARGELGSWTNANIAFLEKKYGKENIVSMYLHLDETTPHIHAVVVPLTPDGRLSAKEIMGNKNDLKELQSVYAEHMKPFNLERGKIGSKAKHEDVKEYYKRVNTPENINFESPFLEQKGVALERLKKEVVLPLQNKLTEQEYKNRVIFERTKENSLIIENNRQLKEEKNKIKGALEIREKELEAVQRLVCMTALGKMDTQRLTNIIMNEEWASNTVKNIYEEELFQRQQREMMNNKNLVQDKKISQEQKTDPNIKRGNDMSFGM